MEPRPACRRARAARTVPPAPAVAAAAAALALALGLAALAPSVRAADHRLRAVADATAESLDGLVALEGVVESRSEGVIDVESLANPGPCADAAACLRALEDGSLDILAVTPEAAGHRFPYLRVLDLPYVLVDDRVAERVLSGNLVRELRRQILTDSDDALRLMSIGSAGGWRHFANTERPVRGPGDLEGMAIDAAPTEPSRRLIEAIGARPVSICDAELVTALRTGAVDGVASGVVDIADGRLPEAGLRYLTLDGHAYAAGLWFMSEKAFKAMPEDLRRVVVDGFEALRQASFAASKRTAAGAYAAFADAGGEIRVPDPAQRRAFQSAADPVHARFVRDVEGGERWLELLRDEVDRAVAAHEAAYEMDLN